AVLSAFRREGVGSALIRAALNDIVLKEGDVKCYLHAQKEVIGLYAKFGFQKVGKEFPECGIIHQTMEKTVME
ncbi:MAG: GNAT family N-acetyltransferase, partial [Cyclobacteriaceae bacterium]|nr:GNAT family N-acetyltransferase [Cyclobacteriaceae bacterium]